MTINEYTAATLTGYRSAEAIAHGLPEHPLWLSIPDTGILQGDTAAFDGTSFAPAYQQDGWFNTPLSPNVLVQGKIPPSGPNPPNQVRVTLDVLTDAVYGVEGNVTLTFSTDQSTGADHLDPGVGYIFTYADGTLSTHTYTSIAPSITVIENAPKSGHGGLARIQFVTDSGGALTVVDTYYPTGYTKATQRLHLGARIHTEDDPFSLNPLGRTLNEQQTILIDWTSPGGSSQ